MSVLFQLKDFSVYLEQREGRTPLVERIDLEVRRGETLCVVGESGSGKSVTFLAATRLLEYTAPISIEGQALLLGDDLAELSQVQMSQIRGHRIAMIFQEAMEALNPTRNVAAQLIEAYMLTQGARRPGKKAVLLASAAQKARTLLAEVGMPDPDGVLKKYPHQLSGGMQQRVMIAMALMGDPELLIADEPTTALDVTIQAEILSLLQRLQQERSMSIVLITHDMGVASIMADRIAVLYAGQIIEVGPTESILRHPLHAYTRALLECVPRPNKRLDCRMRTIGGSVPTPGAASSGDRFAPRNPLASAHSLTHAPPVLVFEEGQHTVRSWEPVLEWTPEKVDLLTRDRSQRILERPAISDDVVISLTGVNKTYASGRTAFAENKRRLARETAADHDPRAVKDLDLEIRRGEFFGLVGETGSGKSTLGKMILALEEADRGSRIEVAGFDLSRKRSLTQERRMRRAVQMIFQNPADALDPRRTVAQAIDEPLRALTTLTKSEREQRVREMLDAVGLTLAFAGRYASELSGGQVQRVAIARAIAPSPSVIVADEPTSALDVSVQGQVVNLLLDLQAELGLTYVFITHNLSLITSIADRVGVMHRGELVELLDTAAGPANPVHDYTRRLLAANPDIDARVRAETDDPPGRNSVWSMHQSTGSRI